MRVWLVLVILAVPAVAAAVSPQQTILAPRGQSFGSSLDALGDGAVIRALSDEDAISAGNGPAGMWLYERAGDVWSQTRTFSGCQSGVAAWTWVLGVDRLHEPAACEAGEPPSSPLARVVNIIDPVNTGRVRSWDVGGAGLPDTTMGSDEDRINYARSMAAGDGWWATTWESSDLLRLADTDDRIDESLDQEAYDHVGIYLGDAATPAWSHTSGPDSPGAYSVTGVDKDIFVSGPDGFQQHLMRIGDEVIEMADGMTMPPGAGHHGTRTYVAAGEIHVVRRTSGGWIPDATIPVPGGMNPTGAADADGNVLAIGIAALERVECEGSPIPTCTTYVDRPGLALVYHRTSDGAWILHETVAGPNQPDIRFGVSLAVTGNQILIGAPGYNEFGAAFIRTMNQWPTAAFESTPDPPLTLVPVTFVDKSTDPEKQRLVRQWDFDGDGEWDATGATATWTFQRPGPHPVTLRVEDTQEGVDVVTQVIDVQNRLPSVDFHFDPSPVWRMRDTNAFAMTWDLDGEVVSWQWDFGDGRTSSEQNPMIMYPHMGRYLVKLTATDDHGDSVTREKWIDVFNHAPVIDFTLDRAPISLEPFTVTAQATDPDGTIVSTQWVGVDATGSTWTHLPRTPDSIRVGFEAVDDEGATTRTFLDIDVENRPPTASFTHDPARSTKTPILFRSSASDPDGRIAAWAWDFGDGNTTADPHPSHAYEARGTYDVSLQVIDDHGAWSQVVTSTLTIDNRAPTARIEVVREGASFRLLDNSWDADGDAILVTWSLDGEPRGSAPNWTIVPTGTQVVRLRATDVHGAWANATAIIGESTPLAAPRVSNPTPSTSTSTSATPSPTPSQAIATEEAQELATEQAGEGPIHAWWPWLLAAALIVLATAAFVVRRSLAGT